MATKHLAHPLESQRKVRRAVQHDGAATDGGGVAREGGVSRRAFLRTGMYRAIGLAVTTQAGVLGVMFWPTKVGAFGSVMKAGRVEDFPVDSITRVRDGEVFVDTSKIRQRAKHLPEHVTPV